MKPFQGNFFGRRWYCGDVLPLEGGWCMSFNLCAFGTALHVITGYRRAE